MASLKLKNIYKIYPGGVKAVSDFNLDIEDKEFVVFVGPSGCGKSTTLRMVAGLEEISAGELYIDDRIVNDVEPKDRDIAMVFQNYALYPHMTVYDNMAFGLRLRRMPSAEIDKRVKEAAAILGITPLLSRKPKALSGGQRQRVALGRAIVREPKVFLLDEPLSNLDAKLRVQMRTEITKLHNKLATTFIYVTHDQTEAMTMGTRIVVMKDGFIMQVDTPQYLYDNPDNLFVASFLGSPQMNFFNARLVRETGKVFAIFGDREKGEKENKIEIPVSQYKRIMDDTYFGKDVILGVRPEDIKDEEVFIANSPQTTIEAYVDVIEKLGNETILYMKVDGKEDYTVARIDARSRAVQGENIRLAIDANHIHLFDPTTEQSIMGVPKFNKIRANFTQDDKGLHLSFGNSYATLNNSSIERIVDFKSLGGDVFLEIAPEDLLDRRAYEEAGGLERPHEFFNVTGTVDFAERFQRFTAVYTQVEGKRGYVVSKHTPDCALDHGKVVNFYVDVNKIILRDIDTSEKITASQKVTKNEANSQVKIGTLASVKFPGVKISTPVHEALNSSGTFTTYIDPNKISIRKADISKYSKATFSASIIAADCLGSRTVVYAKVNGVKDYFTAIVDDVVDYNAGDRVKFCILPEAVTTVQPISFANASEPEFVSMPLEIELNEPMKESITDKFEPTSVTDKFAPVEEKIEEIAPEPEIVPVPEAPIAVEEIIEVKDEISEGEVSAKKIVYKPRTTSAKPATTAKKQVIRKPGDELKAPVKKTAAKPKPKKEEGDEDLAKAFDELAKTTKKLADKLNKK